MITFKTNINGNIYNFDFSTFGDNSLKGYIPKELSESNEIYICWTYDNDSELFRLISIVDYLKDELPNTKYYLILPYVPNARQDRNVSGMFFTLKSFAKIINNLKFTKVFVYDVHSDVSTALLDRSCEIERDEEFNKVARNYDAVLYPDSGAGKRYFNPNFETIIGTKHRNSEGKINFYQIGEFDSRIKSVIIRDDICSTGGTFSSAAKVLKERGVEKIALWISHCENHIIEGEVFKYVNVVYTTDSICTLKDDRIKFFKKWREI